MLVSIPFLSAIARMTPCRFGLECDDVECIYGHRCPQSEPGKVQIARGEHKIRDCHSNFRNFDNVGVDTMRHGLKALSGNLESYAHLGLSGPFALAIGL
jgi:hypothetical protein